MSDALKYPKVSPWGIVEENSGPFTITFQNSNARLIVHKDGEMSFDACGSDVTEAAQLFFDNVIKINNQWRTKALDSAEATLDAMSRDETTTPEQMVEAVRAMKKRYQEDG